MAANNKHTGPGPGRLRSVIGWLASGLCLAVLLSLVFWGKVLAARGSPAAPDAREVLVLLPYQVNLPTSSSSVQAALQEFGNIDDVAVELYFEFVDINRFSDPAYQREFFDWLANKYRGMHVDLVIVQNEMVLKLWLVERERFLTNTPVVFYDIPADRLAGWQLPENVSGVSGVVDHKKSVEWFLQARPDVNEVFVVHGVGAVDQVFIHALDGLAAQADRQIKITDVSNLPLAEIKRRAASMPESAVIAYELMFEDAAGVKYRPIDALRELAAVSSVPVISSYEQFIGTGTIGGYMYSIDRQARAAVHLGARILRGEKLEARLYADPLTNMYIFDHPALLRFNIPLSALPPESIVQNRQYSIWELYQGELGAIAVIFAALLLLTAYLFIIMRRLNSASRSLTRLNTDLESQVRERTLMLNQTNQRLEEEIAVRKQANEALRESETRFRTIIERAPVAVSIGREGRLLYANPAYAKMHGFDDPNEVIGSTTLEHIAPSHRKESLERSEMRKLGMPVDEQYEVTAVRKDGSEFPIISGVTRINMPDGPANIGFFQDITRLKRAESALRESHEQLEQHVQERTAELIAANRDLEKAAQMKDEFLASMSHELRTPLTGILGLADVMQMPNYGELSDKQKQGLAHIRASGQHLLELINDILDLARVEAGKMVLNRTTFALEKTCRSCLKHVMHQAEAKRLRASLVMQPEGIMLAADELRVKQILNNLLSNAVKFTPADGSFGIEVECRENEKLVRMTVWDTGIGISDENKLRLFQSFVQLDARLDRQYGGTGLGLALVRRLTELHGGSVDVQSTPGEGSRFTVSLPWE